MTLDKNIGLAFRKSFEDKCHQLIVIAYKKIVSDKKNVTSLLENDISAILNENIKLSSKSIEWKIFSKTENYIFKGNQDTEKGFADKLSRIDFVFSVFTSDAMLEYFIEAKKLKENDSQYKRRYIKTGVDSFISGKYDNGCLVGYLVEGDLNKTVQGINSLLKKDTRVSESLIKKTLPIHNNYYESAHQKIGILKHLIFNFSQ